MSELIDKPKRSFKSIIAVPIKVEMQPIEHASNHVLGVDELSSQIDEARKGKAKVDNHYVGYNEAGHLFDYEYDYVEFLDNMKHIIQQAKERRFTKPDEVYKNPHNMKIG